MMTRYSHRSSQVPHAQHHIFELIRQHGSITQGQLLELLDVRSSSLSEILRKLESNGLIVRRRNEVDKRGFILSINQDGPAGFPQMVEPRQSAAQHIFSCLEDEEQQQLRTLLVKVITHLGQEGLADRGPGEGHHRQKQGKGRGRRGGKVFWR
jgi:DNA-binding MarR family transcriptional regulator